MSGYVGAAKTFTPVEYIESTGTQYIDTGFYADQNTRIEVKARPIGMSSGENWQCLFSSKTNYHWNEFVIQINQSLAKWYTAFSDTDVTYSSAVDNTDYVIDKNKNVTTINGNTTTITNGTFVSTQPVFIFADLENDTPTHFWRGRVYYLKIYDDGTLARDFIPAIDNENVPCMLDLVENKPYYNQGSGTFTTGPATGEPTITSSNKAQELININVGVQQSYALVDYIENTGAEVLDTNFKPNNNTRVECKIVLTNSISNYLNIFNGRDSYANHDFAVMVKTNGWYSGFGSYTNEPSSPTPQLNVEYIIDKNKNVLKINSSTTTLSNNTFQSTRTIKVFADENVNVGGRATFKLYYFKIYDNGVLARDFKPAVDSNGVGCFYEEVEGKLYYSTTQTQFAGQTPTTSYTDLGEVARRIIKGYAGIGGTDKSIYQTWKSRFNYIEAHGTADWIDTGYYPNSNTKIDVDFWLPTRGSSQIWDRIFSSYNENQDQDYFGLTRNYNSNTTFWFFVGGGSTNQASITISATTRHRLVATNSYIRVDSTTSSFSAVTYESPYSLRIFRGYDRYGYVRIYRFKIFENNVLIHDYIPVFGAFYEVGLYDNVTKTFLYNQGNDHFWSGLVISENSTNNETATLNSISPSASLMNTGSLVGMGDRAEATNETLEKTKLDEVTDKDIGEIERAEEKTEGSGDTIKSPQK